MDLAPDTHVLARARPVYRDLPGWMDSTAGASNYDELPPNAQLYVRTVEEVTGIPVALVGTGQHRTALITRDASFAVSS